MRPSDSIAGSLLYQRIEQLAKEASGAEEGRNYARAVSLYSQLAHCEEQYGDRHVSDPQARATWKKRSASHLAYADRLSRGSVGPEKKPAPEKGSDDSAGPGRRAESGDRAELLSTVDSLIVKDSATRWEDIAGLDETKKELKEAFGVAIAQKPVGVELPKWERVLLYGPPGTGKTLLASAVVGSIPGSTFFNAQLSRLKSKWYGETGKLISLLYQRAREESPSVVFLDEVDDIAVSRDQGGQHEATISSQNSLLQELSGLHDHIDARFVLTFAATNRPRVLDKAFLSRFGKKVYVPLPDSVARREIFRLHLEAKGIAVEMPYDELAALADTYSGREIASLCTQAVMYMVEESNPSLPDLVDKGVEALRNYTLKLRPLVRKDFDRALGVVKPETKPEDIEYIEAWRREMGF